MEQPLTQPKLESVVEIRPADAGDIEALADMYRREAELQSRLQHFWSVRPGFDWHKFAADLAGAPGRQILVATLDGTPAGFIFLRFQGATGQPTKPSLARRLARRLRNQLRGEPPVLNPNAAIEAPPVGIIEDCFVNETARRHGIGTKLVEEGLRWLQGHGMRQVQLSVAAANDGAVTFWQSFGFEIGRHRMDLDLG